MAEGLARYYHSVTDVGRDREANEDSRAEYALGDGGVLLVVADGMGGHENGEVASRIAVEALGQIFQNSPAPDPRDKLKNGFLVANQRILTEAERLKVDGMGTTAVAAYVRGNQAYIAHVGDSRLYHVRDGALLWRTTDHTRVQKMVQMGILSAADAKDHPDANVVSRALGFANLADGTALEPEVQPDAVDLRPGDSLILCTDGLFDGVTDVEIAGSVAGRTAADCARYLVDLANERGGHDNITVTVLHYGKETGAKAGPPSSKSLGPGQRRVTSVDEGGRSGGNGGNGNGNGKEPGKAAGAAAAAASESPATRPAANQPNRKALVLILLGIGLLLAGTGVFWYTRHKNKHGGAPPVPVPDASVGGGGPGPEVLDAAVGGSGDDEVDAAYVPKPGEVPGIIVAPSHSPRPRSKDGGVAAAAGKDGGTAGARGKDGGAGGTTGGGKDGGVKLRGTSGTPPLGVSASPSPSPSKTPTPSVSPAKSPAPSVSPSPSPSKKPPSPSPSPSGATPGKPKPTKPDDGTVG